MAMRLRLASVTFLIITFATLTLPQTITSSAPTPSDPLLKATTPLSSTSISSAEQEWEAGETTLPLFPSKRAPAADLSRDLSSLSALLPALRDWISAAQPAKSAPPQPLPRSSTQQPVKAPPAPFSSAPPQPKSIIPASPSSAPQLPKSNAPPASLSRPAPSRGSFSIPAPDEHPLPPPTKSSAPALAPSPPAPPAPLITTAPLPMSFTHQFPKWTTAVDTESGKTVACFLPPDWGWGRGCHGAGSPYTAPNSIQW